MTEDTRTGSGRPERTVPATGTADHADELSSVPAGLGADAVLSAVLDATRALLWVTTAAEASAVARDLVSCLGGVTVAAGRATGDAMPVDLSFGVDEPVLPAAPGSSVARMLLERHLPTFVRDAHRALALAERPTSASEDIPLGWLASPATRSMPATGGHAYLPTDLDASLVPPRDRRLKTVLTKRELEVLQLVATGLTNRHIAGSLNLSFHTVRNHVQSLLVKLGAHSKLEAVAIAVHEGLVSRGE